MNDIQSALADGGRTCTGCGGCAQVCPVHAISMEPDASGCLYPRVDESACVRCGKCLKLCGRIADMKKAEPAEAYAAVGACESLVRHSASGGVFACTAMEWIRRGGSVAGAVMDCTPGGVHVHHILSDREEDVRRMQGSKYVHSDAWRCYGDVLDALKRGRNVLFSGTPCQAAAIKALSGDPPNLVTMDLICHGVPPQAMLNEYAGILSKRFAGSVENLVFRDKTCQKAFCAGITVRRGRRAHTWHLRSHDLSYYTYFLEGALYRENCYSCPYAGMSRVSDVTIGDYWGIEARHGEDFAAGKMPERSDWSCVLAVSEKGSAFLETYGQALNLYKTQADWIRKGNQQLQSPMKKPEQRDALLAAYREGGYRAIEDAFIRDRGGKLRFAVRTIRSLYRNHRARGAKREDGHED